MKTLSLTLIAAVTVAALASSEASARPGRGGYSGGGHHGGGHHNHHHHNPAPRGGSDDLAAGIAIGAVGVSAGIMTSEAARRDNYKELILLGADEEAAQFLANGGQPSAMLQEAMKLERSMLKDAGDATAFSDEQIAERVMLRAGNL